MECLCIHWESHICWQIDILWATIRNAICSVPWQTGFKNLMGLNAGGFSPALPSPPAPIPMIFWFDLGSALWLTVSVILTTKKKPPLKNASYEANMSPFTETGQLNKKFLFCEYPRHHMIILIFI